MRAIAIFGLWAATVAAGSPAASQYTCRAALQVVERDKTAMPMQRASSWNTAGVACAKENDLKSAERAFQNALEARPAFAEASVNLAQVYGMSGRHGAAAGILQNAVESERDAGWLLRIRVSLAKELSASKKFKEAAAVLKLVVAEHSESADAHCELGTALTGQEIFGQAAQEFEKCLAIDPTRSGVLLAFGNALVAAHAAVEAIPKLRDYVKQFPQDARAHYLLGRAYAASSTEGEEARRELELATALDDKLYDAHYFLGVQLAKARQMEQALTELKAAGELRPGAQEVHHALAKLYRESGREDSADREYSKLRALAAQASAAAQATMELNKGTAALQSGNADAARISYQRALELNRSDPKIPYSLSLAWNALGDQTARKAMLEEAIRLDPNMAAAWNELGLVARQSGKNEHARRFFERAIVSDPEYVEAANNLAVLYTDRGELERAAELLRRAIADRPGYADALLNLGLVEAAKSEWGAAERHIRQALRISSGNPAAWIALGLIERQMQHPEESRRMFETALAADPGSKAARQYLQEPVAATAKR